MRISKGCKFTRWLMGVLGVATMLVTAAAAALGSEVVFREALAIEPLGRAGRNTIFTDALEYQLVTGTWKPPQADQSVALASEETKSWKTISADADGWFSGPALRGGWVYCETEVPEDRVMVLRASGHSMAYINGVPQPGDIYQYGYVQVPVLLHAGRNELLFAAGRGRLRVQLSPVTAPAMLNVGDPTVPDLRVGEKLETWAAVVVVNASTSPLAEGELTMVAEVSGRTSRTPVPSIPPLGVRKVGFRVEAAAPKSPGTAKLQLKLVPTKKRNATLDQATVDLRVRAVDQPYKRTFQSQIDGSVQYFAINPGRDLNPKTSPALFLSLHGASVEGIGQAEAYSPKRWGHLVSPTNRRPYGFDWEDWGRLDALEVLQRASAELQPDPQKIYLTGHSMGGHGTWSLGATFPDRFAAIGPSAGWISFFSYAGTDAFTNATPVESMLRRGAASSDTLAMAHNYSHEGVYIIHGDADDNVPVTEARRMREVLGEFHHDFDWHEQPGAGHWWENSDEPGAECVDWPPLFDFFARHRIPADTEVRRIRFVTVNPGVSSRSHWLAIEGQQHALTPSEVEAQWDPGQQRVIAQTKNVRRLTLETADWGAPREAGFTLELDGQKLEHLRPAAEPATVTTFQFPGAPRPWRRPLRLESDGAQWRVAGVPQYSEKGPWRHGPFKDAFRHRFLFVYGTHGTPEENAWALAKARFDAEAFGYRGNGSVEIMADVDFQAARNPDRGVIVYGHRDMNSAWDALLAQSPVQVARGKVQVGDRLIARDDVACLFLQPRPDSSFACVGVVAGSGVAGLNLTRRLPYFLAGTAYPDCLVLGPEFLQRGTAGILGAGFFGPDWSVAQGEFAWQP